VVGKRDRDIERVADNVDGSEGRVRRDRGHAVDGREHCVRLDEHQSGPGLREKLVHPRPELVDFLPGQIAGRLA
jgi:hypothetical protein